MIDLQQVQFSWHPQQSPLLTIDSLQIQQGERVFIHGASGSGKSTLLNILAGVELPQQGTVKVLNTVINQLSSAKRDKFRADHIGFIFQQFNLLPYLSIIDNVTLPCLFSKKRREKALANSPTLRDEALRLLAHLDLTAESLQGRSVSKLSVGQQQRVAAARAIIGAPELLIADEPTSSLDADRRHIFIQLLFEECAAVGSSLVFVSHDLSLTTEFERTVELL